MMQPLFLVALAGLALCALDAARAQPARDATPAWTAAELDILRTLTLSSLPRPARDPSNKYAEDPRAADFGHRLFFDTRLSANSSVACATCHQPARAFTDARPLAVGIGVTPRNAPTIVGAAHNVWFFWDGRKDSLWSQALASIESPLEHDMPRARVLDVIRANRDLGADYVAIFGALPAQGDREGVNRAFANIGKAIAAYERRIMPGPAKFDRYVEALLEDRRPAPQDDLTLDERQGLRVFISDQLGRCLRCHNGPLFTNQHFHNIGVAEPQRQERAHADVAQSILAQGRIAGAEIVLADEFNCTGKYSDARPGECAELDFIRRDSPELLGAFKVPTLRNLTRTAPYMRSGDRRTLEDVMWHYRTLPQARVGKSELNDLPITATEFDQLEAFLRTLEGQIDAPALYLRPPISAQAK
ncbi:MAG: cytochrome-c peroxidase [Proteobacteria bacterium]|nr:cytochrome-c peroxidase [Pseudomonadota bacterium]